MGLEQMALQQARRRAAAQRASREREQLARQLQRQQQAKRMQQENVDDELEALYGREADPMDDWKSFEEVLNEVRRCAPWVHVLYRLDVLYARATRNLLYARATKLR
jgi:hypothetical protein